MRLKPVVALALSAALLLPAPAPAQAAAAAQQPASQPGSLKIVVLEGEGAKNNIRAKSATAPAVEIRDENEKPVAGAEVIFQLPPVGPGGVFHGWMRSQTVRSDASGKAVTSGYTPNEEEGRFNIKVTAVAGAKSGNAVIAQSNVRGTGGANAPKRSWWKVAAVIGGAAIVGGAIAASRGDDTAAAVAKVPVTITPGPVSVGGPR